MYLRITHRAQIIRQQTKQGHINRTVSHLIINNNQDNTEGIFLFRLGQCTLQLRVFYESSIKHRALS